jgi:Fe-S cluster assembly protein SufD
MPNNVAETARAVPSHLHPAGSREPADHPVPTGREEVWRFTPLDRLRGVQEEAPLAGGGVLDAVPGDGLGPEGRMTAAVQPTVVSLVAEPAPGVLARTVSGDDPARGSSGYLPGDRVAARAWQAAGQPFVVTVPREAVVDEPTVVSLTGTGASVAGAGHLVVRAEPFSRATVVLRYRGSATWVDTVELVVGDGAQLTVVSVQEWDRDAVHLAYQHARIGRDASLRHVVVTLGGDLVRVAVSVDYVGTGGVAELVGLYFADAGQHLEHRLFVDHSVPRCRSDVAYKGALQGDGAHTVWVGDVLIRAGAEGTDTYELNRNLVLSDGARADSVPNLEIETGEIAGAGHASATGRFDDEQLFYLQSRGVPEAEARRLVVRGFFAELVQRIGVPELEQELVAAIDRELAGGPTPEAGR